MELFTPTVQFVFVLILVLSLIPMIYRVVRGPHVLDRVMCLDAIALIIICLIAVWKVTIETRFFFDAVLFLTIVGFLTTAALAKYLEDGDLID